MRVLISLCLLAIANAQNSGYNYQPVEQPNTGASYPSYTGGNEQAAYIPPAETAPVRNEPLISAGPVAHHAPAPVQQAYQAPAELHKEFFTYTAADHDFNEPINAEQLSNNLHKNLRVIFIKGPEHNGVQDAALALSKQAAEQHTAIYVLNKQADINDLGNKLNNIRSNNNNKPEVHFVKYRTPEDAANAQRAIQDQYDQLGGVSSHQSGGVAPVLNFASQAPAKAAHVNEPLNSYLPASVLRSRF